MEYLVKTAALELQAELLADTVEDELVKVGEIKNISNFKKIKNWAAKHPKSMVALLGGTTILNDILMYRMGQQSVKNRRKS